MSLPREMLWTFALAAALPPSIYVYCETQRLSRAYPLRTSPVEPLLSVPQDPSRQRVSRKGAEVISARVPRTALAALADKSDSSPNETWARVFLRRRTIQLESRLVAILQGRENNTELAFVPGGILLNGLFTVVEPPSPTRPLVTSWSMPPRAVHFFERLASWGSPWRIMSGGRHSWEVVDDSDGDYVRLEFGCSADFAIANSLTGQEDEKEMPRWCLWAHRMYAKWLLDEAVGRVQGRA
ncbi:hypothetical protein PLICRDRAFT_162811 [Plicaturopsis crispa FD-325 SS-3]|nr:hypothetical protein PLICRDRAFT_162811 [Plicaturopsis crispa FD-325 SS-3]